MNPSRLALLINDTWDAIERSKIGYIYIKDKDGSLLKTPEGGPIANIGAMIVLNTALQALILKEVIYED